MLITLLAWIYITLLCWMWGCLFLELVKKFTKQEFQPAHFSIICITGLSVITVIAAILSLFIPLGTVWVQFLFLFPCLTISFKKNFPAFRNSLKAALSNLQVISICLLAMCLLLILAMSTWTIIHPDTLGYHAQTVQWIEKYKAVPGLVHLHVRFGYQGLWFVDCALFGYRFIGETGVSFINSTVLVWFFIFIIERIDFNFFRGEKKIVGLLWVALLTLCMWSYTQVRLTATSSSPDFIATLFVLTIIYLLLNQALSSYANFSSWLIIAFLSVVAVTIKLSVLPTALVGLIPIILLLKAKKVRSLVFMVVVLVVSFFPFVARNIITSGYVVFPSILPDVANVDWKYDPALTAREKNYITSYAKKEGVSYEEAGAVVKMSPKEWIPGWWQNRSIADKAIILLLVVSLFVFVLNLKKIAAAGYIPILTLLLLLVNLVFWFLNAPDPRFGFGPILGFIGVIAYLNLQDPGPRFQKSIAKGILSVLIVMITAYCGYRFINFFTPDQLLKPIGIKKTGFNSFECEKININSPTAGEYFGLIPIPCTDDPGCKTFSPRGDKIEDGFRSK